MRNFTPGFAYTLNLSLQLKPGNEPIKEIFHSVHFKIHKYTYKQTSENFRLNIKFEPTHPSKHTYEIHLLRHDGSSLQLVFLALSEAHSIFGPSKTAFPSCLVNAQAQKVLTFSTTSRFPLKYEASTFGYVHATEII